MAKSVRLSRTTRNEIMHNVKSAIRKKYSPIEGITHLHEYYNDAVLLDLAAYTIEVRELAKKHGIEQYLSHNYTPSYMDNPSRVSVAGENLTVNIPRNNADYLNSAPIYDRYADGSEFHTKFSKKWALVGKLRRDNAVLADKAIEQQIREISEQARRVVDQANTTAQLEESFEDIAKYYPGSITCEIS